MGRAKGERRFFFFCLVVGAARRPRSPTPPESNARGGQRKAQAVRGAGRGPAPRRRPWVGVRGRDDTPFLTGCRAVQAATPATPAATSRPRVERVLCSARVRAKRGAPWRGAARIRATPCWAHPQSSPDRLKDRRPHTAPRPNWCAPSSDGSVTLRWTSVGGRTGARGGRSAGNKSQHHRVNSPRFVANPEKRRPKNTERKPAPQFFFFRPQRSDDRPHKRAGRPAFF